MKRIAIVFVFFASCQESNTQPHIVTKDPPPTVSIDTAKPEEIAKKDTLAPSIPIPESYTWLTKDEFGNPMLSGHEFNSKIQIMEFDSCQWVIGWLGDNEGGPLFSHYGKCKYCAARRAKENDALYQRITEHIESIVITTAYGNVKRLENNEVRLKNIESLLLTK